METITINNNHKNIYRTYKELNKLMPHNYLKIKVLPSKKYKLPNINIIDIIETKYNPSIITNKIERPKKNIYLFSSELTESNYISEKSSLKDLILIRKSRKNTTRNKSNIKDDNHSEIINSITNDCTRRKGFFNSKGINNFYLRNNIRLPEITQRMKYKIPRNEREKKGLKIIGNENDEFKNTDDNSILISSNGNNFYNDKIENKNNEGYCFSEQNNKRKNIIRSDHIPVNIISILNKNKNKKYTFNIINK